MPQVRVLGRGAHITGGFFCLLYALHTWIWVLRDVLELGFDSTWKVWTGALGPTAGGLTDVPATTADDVGLGLLQVFAAFAAFTGAWTAGGLMAVTTALTLAYRLPVLWHAGLHSESSPYYALRGFFNDPSVDNAWASCVWTVLFCVPLAIVLMAGLRRWTGQTAPVGRAAQPHGGPAQLYGPATTPRPPVPMEPPQPAEPPLPSESPQRPGKAHAVVAAVFLGVLLLFDIGWTVHAFYTAGGQYWLRLFTGEGTVFALLDVSSGWAWLTLILANGAGAALALARTVSARGFSLGLAVVLLPQAVTALWGWFDAGAFFELGDAAPVAGFFSRLQLLITLAGAVTLIVLTARPGVPAQPGAAPVGPVPFGGPVPAGGARRALRTAAAAGTRLRAGAATGPAAAVLPAPAGKPTAGDTAGHTAGHTAAARGSAQHAATAGDAAAPGRPALPRRLARGRVRASAGALNPERRPVSRRRPGRRERG